ncbi:hypothetical protein PUN28_018650 [Cardiocondyla obscurior]|uniref:mRNA export factor GLE1 n=1 Tax=Cardiocondyla obscurior TaxID=286306 RepID=A0AAW2EKS2_9HYME
MDVASDFDRVKASALEKALYLSVTTKIDSITIGPESALYNEDFSKADNIENEKNSCNIKSPQRLVTSPKNNMISTSKGICFSIDKIFHESEQQRQEEVWKKMDCRIQQMNNSSRSFQEQMINSYSLMTRERERRAEEKLEHLLAEEERNEEQEKIKKQLQAQQKLEEHQTRVKEELTRVMLVYRSQFIDKHCALMELFKTCKDQQAFNVILAAYSTKINDLIQQIESLDRKLNNGEIVPTDIDVIQTVICHFDDILNKFCTEIEKINVQYEAELEKKAQAVNEIQSVEDTDNVPVCDTLPSQQPDVSNAVENKEDQHCSVITNQEIEPTPVNKPVTPPISIPDPKLEDAAKNSKCKKGDALEYADQESLKIYIRSLRLLKPFRITCNNFSKSVATKKFRVECQKAINIPVNAISGVSEEHLLDKYERLQNVLLGVYPYVSQIPQAVMFCKNHLAKKLVSQGETLVSSKPETAFPIAAIIVALWNDHLDFGDLFLAHLHETCPFTVPVFLQQQEGQSNEDYYKSLGFKYSEDGIVEEHDKFLKRMSGLMRLYASITVTKQWRYFGNKDHPHGLQYAWRWLAAVLNIEPRGDICDLCATLILDMLEVAGNKLWAAYPKQFYKLLILLMEQYYPRMRSVASSNGGPFSRLEDFLNDTLRTGTIRPPNGMFPPNFL